MEVLTQQNWLINPQSMISVQKRALKTYSKTLQKQFSRFHVLFWNVNLYETTSVSGVDPPINSSLLVVLANAQRHPKKKFEGSWDKLTVAHRLKKGQIRICLCR